MNDSQQGVEVVVVAVGFVSLGLLWLGLVLGLVLRDGRALDHMRPATLAANHQTMIVCGLMLAAVHALGQLAVAGSGTDLLAVFVPFLHATQPIAAGLGVIGLELAIALAASMALRRRIGYHRWRVLHRLTYVAFALIVVHVVSVGPDVRSWWLRIPILLAATATLAYGLTTAGWLSAYLSHILRTLAAGKRERHVVTIDVDAARCVHFGFCQHEAPELFELRSDGRLRFARRATAEQADAATRAARVCPTLAIRLGGDTARVVVSDSQVVDAESADAPHTGRPAAARHGADATVDAAVIDAEVVDGDLIDGDPTDGGATGARHGGETFGGETFGGETFGGERLDGEIFDGEVIDGEVVGDAVVGDAVVGDEVVGGAYRRGEAAGDAGARFGGARINGARINGERTGHAFTA